MAFHLATLSDFRFKRFQLSRKENFCSKALERRNISVRKLNVESSDMAGEGNVHKFVLSFLSQFHLEMN